LQAGATHAHQLLGVGGFLETTLWRSESSERFSKASGSRDDHDPDLRQALSVR
jgi:hypothetical protein